MHLVCINSCQNKLAVLAKPNHFCVLEVLVFHLNALHLSKIEIKLKRQSSINVRK